MQINMWLHLSISQKVHFAATYAEKNTPEKIPFIATNNWIVLAVWWSVKYFYASNSLIFQKSCVEKEEAEDQ